MKTENQEAYTGKCKLAKGWSYPLKKSEVDQLFAENGIAMICSYGFSWGVKEKNLGMFCYYPEDSVFRIRAGMYQLMVGGYYTKYVAF